MPYLASHTYNNNYIAAEYFVYNTTIVCNHTMDAFMYEQLLLTVTVKHTEPNRHEQNCSGKTNWTYNLVNDAYITTSYSYRI